VHRGALDALATALLERETLDEREILTVTGLPPAPPIDTRPLEGKVAESPQAQRVA
jgi:cell division protease FtsH